MKQGFNFLKPQVEPPSAWMKIYEWVVGTARIILVVAEVGVIVALGIRVVIDVQGKQLDEQIKNLEAIINVSQADEARFRAIQNRISDYEAAWTGGSLYTPVVTLIDANLPVSAQLINVNMSADKINISGTATNKDIDTMEQNLKKSPYFSETKLTRLEVSDSSANAQVKFTFDTKINTVALKTLITPTPIVSPTPVVSPTQ